MYRVAFAFDDSGDRHLLGAALRHLTLDGAHIAAAFADANTAEIFLDLAESAVPRAVADRVASQLGVRAYEMTRVDALPTGARRCGVTVDRTGRRLATITQVRVHDDDRTVSVQVRHRPYETLDAVEVRERDDSIVIAVFVAAGADDDAHFVSLATAFTWVEAVLARPVGHRAIARDALDIRTSADLSPEEVLARLERLVARRSVSNAR